MTYVWYDDVTYVWYDDVTYVWYDDVTYIEENGGCAADVYGMMM